MENNIKLDSYTLEHLADPGLEGVEAILFYSFMESGTALARAVEDEEAAVCNYIYHNAVKTPKAGYTRVDCYDCYIPSPDALEELLEAYRKAMEAAMGRAPEVFEAAREQGYDERDCTERLFPAVAWGVSDRMSEDIECFMRDDD